MKKILMLIVATMAITFVSCGTDVESKAENYAKQTVEALINGDLAKVQEIAKEAASYAENLSEDDRKAFNEAMQKYTEEHKKEIDEAFSGSIGKALKSIKL